MKMAYRQRKTGRKGQAMTELALVLPVLLLLVMSIIQFGLILKSYIAVVNGARLGARTAAVGKTNAQITSKVRESLPALDKNMLAIAISPSDEAARTSGTDVTISVSYQENIIVPLFNLLIPDPVPNNAHGKTGK